jgi:RNA polymerase sigma factor (sigma-70 family)
MNYLSTEGRSPAAGFREAVLAGLAPDGGLYVPESLPLLPQAFLEDLSEQNLQSIGFEAASTFQSKSSFRTWLYTIAMNLIRDDFRRRNVRKESLVSEMDTLEILMEAKTRAITTMETTVMDRMAASQMWEAVDRLPEAQRSAVMLRFRHELTYDEISQVMGAPSGTVKSWIHFALKKLRGELRPPESEDQI